MRFARIRKAVVAGAGAGLSAALTHQVTVGWKIDAESIGQSVGAFLAAGIPVAVATWRVRNAQGYGQPVR